MTVNAPPLRTDGTDATAHPRNTRGLILLSIGVLFTTVAVGLLARTVIAVSVLQADALASISAESVSYRVAFGLIEREMSVLTFLMAVPGMLLVTATCFLIPGYLRRRGMIEKQPTRRGRPASHTASYLPLPLGAHAVWALVPLAAWALLIVVPVRNLIGGESWPAGLRYEAETEVWLLLACYGGLAGALFVVVVTSLIKKMAYLRRIEHQPEAAQGGPGRGTWRWLTFRWRFDLWIAGIGGMFLGLCWIAIGFGDTPFFLSALLIGVALIAGGVVLSLNYWRAGEPLGAGESYS